MPLLTLDKNCTQHKLAQSLASLDLSGGHEDAIRIIVPSGMFIHSAALALLCSWGLEQQRQGRTWDVVGDDRDLSYLARMDLFKHLDIPYTERFTRHDAEERFVPLLLVGDGHLDIGQAVEQVCSMVAAHLTQADSFLPALQWTVQELLDNVANHAGSQTPGVLCAQHYPKKHRLDLAISDMGCGIKASLGDAHGRIYSHGDAITKALETGVTRDPEVGQGNGLSGSREIIRENGGDLQIWTGDATFHIKKGVDKGFEVTDNPLPGTGIAWSLRTQVPVDLAKTSIASGSEGNLLNLRKTGKKIDDRISIQEACEHVGGRAPARKLREEILRRLDNHTGESSGHVTLSFKDVPTPSSSFLDELLGRLAAEVGPTQFRKRIHLEDVPSIVESMANKVIQQRLDTDAPQHRLPAIDEIRPSPYLHAFPTQTLLALGHSEDEAARFAATFPTAPAQVHTIALQPGWLPHLQAQLQAASGPTLLVLPWVRLTRAESEALDFHPGRSPAFSSLNELLQSTPQRLPDSLWIPGDLMHSPYALEVREALWQGDHVRVLMELHGEPQGLGVFTGLLSTVLQLGQKHEKAAPHAVLMVNTHRWPEVPDTAKAIKKALEQARRKSNVPYAYRANWESADTPLSFARLHPDLRTATDSLTREGGSVPLKTLVTEAHAGMPLLSSKSKARTRTEPEPIGGKDVSIGLDHLPRRATPKGSHVTPDVQLQTGDLLICRLKSHGSPIRTRVVPEHLEGQLFTDSVFCLRFATPEHRQLVMDYLPGKFATQWIDAQGASHSLTLSKLLELPIPDPDGRIASISGSLLKTSETIQAFASRFETARKSLLDVSNIQEALEDFTHLSTQGRMAITYLEGMEDLSFLIRTTFPLPLALLWRSCEVEERPRERLSGHIQLFGATLRFLTILLLADLRDSATQMSRLEPFVQRFSPGGNPPTEGDWFALLQQNPNLSDSDLDQSAFPELRLLLQDKQGPWWTQAQQLLGTRNDVAHNRGPRTDREFLTTSQATEAILYDFFSRLTFLSRYPLVSVLESHFDELTQERTIKYRELIGDHEVLPLRTRTLSRECGRHLYVQDKSSDLRLLSPWMDFIECPECGHREIMIPESASRTPASPGVVYLSLTTGHHHTLPPATIYQLSHFLGLGEVTT